MSYSRTRTYREQRSRAGSRIRRLAALNLALLAAVTGVVVWLVMHRQSDGSAFERASQPTNAAATAPASPSAASAASAAVSPAASPAATPSSPADTAAGADEPADLPAGGKDQGGPDADDKQVTLAFVGDVLPAGSVARLMQVHGYDYPYLKARSLLETADITAGNLEAPITGRGTAAKNKKYLFRGPAAALPALKDAGFDVFTLANNHTLDYGWVGLQDTMDALDDHKLKHVGAGSDGAEALTPVFVEANGVTVAFLGVSHVLPEVSWKAAARHPGVADAYNPLPAEEAVRAAKQEADLVVVMVHWGDELADKPDQDQIRVGHRFIDAGADLVIGSHPHVLQGFEYYKDKWIAYSLGNFVFNTTASPKTSETGVLRASCTKAGSCTMELTPMRAVNSQPAPMTEEAGKALLARLSAVSSAAVLEENGNLVAKR